MLLNIECTNEIWVKRKEGVFFLKVESLERLDKRKSSRIRYGWDTVNKWFLPSQSNLYNPCWNTDPSNKVRSVSSWQSIPTEPETEKYV